MTLDRQETAEDHVAPDLGLVTNQTDSKGGEPNAEPAESDSLSEAKYPSSFRLDVVNVVRGFCMGAANIVPGVSGGTVALVLGHYQRLIDAVSQIDSHLASLAWKRRWKACWEYADVRFLAGIGLGVVLGTAVLTGMLTWLLEHRMPETLAVFLGMILASLLIVRRQISRWNPLCYAACAAGVIAAVSVGRLSPTDGGDSLLYLFVSASLAICAMILPGISGSFILLLLGVYHPVLASIKNFFKLNLDINTLLQLAVFSFGCLFGLLAFSRLLSWLLKHQRDVTMAALVGLMIGSIEKLWPLQVPTPETATLEMKERVMQHVSPADWDGSLVLLVALVLIAAVFVLILERVAAAPAGDADLSAHEHDG